MDIRESIPKTRFAIVGGGWRAEFFLRIARELPDRFEVVGAVVRSAEKAAAFRGRWEVPAYASTEELERDQSFDFAVVSVAKDAAAQVIGAIASKGIPVLAETPPAQRVDELAKLHELVRSGAKIQVAEQYHLHPGHAARLSIVHSGILGAVDQAQVSFSHGYHAISLLRKFLNVGFQNVVIRGMSRKSPGVAGPGRTGLPDQENLVDATQDIAWLDFDGKFGVYDFTKDQHRSYIRSQHILVRGDRGEVRDDTVRYLKDFRTPVQYDLIRSNAGEGGNMEGYHLKGILAGTELVYRNPFAPGRLSDDEIAVASCLENMGRYVSGGPEFYGVAEAAQDQYLATMMDRATSTGEVVTTETQSWAL